MTTLTVELSDVAKQVAARAAERKYDIAEIEGEEDTFDRLADQQATEIAEGLVDVVTGYDEDPLYGVVADAFYLALCNVHLDDSGEYWVHLRSVATRLNAKADELEAAKS